MHGNDFANALTAEVPLTPVVDGHVFGHPQTGDISIASVVGAEVGVWEMTPGVMTDTEVDEIFVVLRGAATVEFLDGGEPLNLVAGSSYRFDGGTRTRWTVTETLRKIYVVGEGEG